MWLDVDGLTVWDTDWPAEEPGAEMVIPPVKPFLSPGLRKVFRYKGSLMYSLSV